MNVQSKSVNEIIDRCESLNKKIVAGGPLFTEEPDNFPKVDHFVLNEAEITLPEFIYDLIYGVPKRMYQSEKFADLKDSPIPDYSLVKISKYNTLNIQYTRGCPFNCEFCDITALFGHKVRAKSTKQIINELETIYKIGWQKNIFFVDDNFIGIETTEETSLSECGKSQNKNRNLVYSVRKIQKQGIEVSGGFILGFDNDSLSVF